MSSPSCDSTREHKRIDLLFSKFAAFYGHIWRSQFKDEGFLKFAKKEWHEGLSVFSDAVFSEAIIGCREQYEMPPTLPQMIYYCKQIRKRKEFRIREEVNRAQESVVALNVKRCLELLA
ncbi:Vir protein [Fluoribacter dumoffii]|uniref:Vir protein n=1 Tax=Fluoribacter dumoffii TaxID=463 RepID=UPI00224489C5|nr:Vir protein [Fluoribacter dumoffii]MCW8452973.1 Vir protein [Fluoribacter dumoffii]MCW8483166.1 Vir protein [Fluoribacter dumoffii]